MHHYGAIINYVEVRKTHFLAIPLLKYYSYYSGSYNIYLSEFFLRGKPTLKNGRLMRIDASSCYLPFYKGFGKHQLLSLFILCEIQCKKSKVVTGCQEIGKVQKY